LPTQHGPGPLGAKAAGELTNTTVAPAIANALAAAGARVFDLPLTAERVLEGLERT
jgi:CO/xanthine dehydrogenase Mo-binding subunit